MPEKKTKKEDGAKKELGQVVRFAIVGVSNFLVDFIVLNLLVITILPKSLNIFSFSIFGVKYVISGVILAGIISGTAAMINSFIFNKNFTFKAKKLSTSKLIMFFIITAAGLYLIRPVILYLFTDLWLWPSQIAYKVTTFLKLPLSQDFDTNNVALLVAILVVLVYNYLFYKFYIFRDEK